MQLQEVRVKRDNDLARTRRLFHDPSIVLDPGPKA